MLLCFAHIAAGWNWAFNVATESMIYLSSTKYDTSGREERNECTGKSIPGVMHESGRGPWRAVTHHHLRFHFTPAIDDSHLSTDFSLSVSYISAVECIRINSEDSQLDPSVLYL
ncbi:hypothetical protein MPH_12399 [Macrophomina phaseolina MS6]|uniref:Secreted protein n=1 Tax=Macrophomina phaseolina (strain MS6) TaxID=1126212 RepID=K2QL85_MACPH|nr:hypothetical protein MPH_12399 [Macrophomina phaseolina MS6]